MATKSELLETAIPLSKQIGETRDHCIFLKRTAPGGAPISISDILQTNKVLPQKGTGGSNLCTNQLIFSFPLHISSILAAKAH